MTAPDTHPGRSPYCLITASAGSGKTWQLTNRILHLLLAGEPPESVVALTFTRKAAAEFFDTVLGRLAAAASGPEEAEKLCQALQIPARLPEAFLGPLRTLARSLHRLQLSTIDSFFHRIAGAFPFELGLGGAFTLLDAFSEEQAKDEALSLVLQRGESGEAAREAFLDSFRQATWGTESKQLARSLQRYIGDYYELFRESGGPGLWGGNSLPDWLRAPEKEEDAEALLEAISQELARLKLKPRQEEAWDKSREAFRNWQPHLQLASPASTVWKNLVEAWRPQEQSCEPFNLGGSKIEPGARLAGLLHRLAELWRGRAVRSAARQTRGIASLLAAYDQAYDALIRRRGRLVFGDLPWLLDPRRAGRLDPLGLEFRLDARFDHWLLDEFQDTSRPQWRVLENLIDEILQDPSGRRTFFCVGDIKQSLYGWRGGDHRLFDDLRAHYAPHLQEAPMAETRRCARAVVDYVNQVLGNGERLAALLPHGGPEWNANWIEHRSARAEEGLACYLEVPQTPAAEGEDAGRDPRHEAIVALLEDLKPVERGLTCAVLVFSNDEARLIADVLHAQTSLPVVLEGEVRVATDNFYGLALIAWARALAHPLDALAEGWLLASPLRGMLENLGTDWRGVEWEQLHARGFEAAAERLFRELELQAAPDAFHRQRRRSLLLACRQFDLAGSRDPDAFAAFLEARRQRAPETPGAVQVMTVHKSKGLGFDVVLATGLVRKTRHLNQRRKGPLCGRGDARQLEWICEAPATALLKAVPEARAHLQADEAENVYEQLCLLYVAMTRARDALYLIGDGRNAGASVYLQSILREASGPSGDSLPALLPGIQTRALLGNPHWAESRRAKAAPADAPPPPPGAMAVPAGEREALLPSEIPDRNAPAFAWDAGNAAAREHGRLVHALLARVERITPGLLEQLGREASSAPSAERAAWQEALACLVSNALQACFHPGPGILVWREKPFDVSTPDGRISGIFDRVHLLLDSDGRAAGAELLDFKTEPARDPESQARHHAGQLGLYRKALASLTGLPEGAIAINVVFTRPPALCRL